MPKSRIATYGDVSGADPFGLGPGITGLSGGGGLGRGPARSIVPASPQATRAGSPVRIMDAKTQEGALYKMAELVMRDSLDPWIMELGRAIKIAAGCTDRDDFCELEAIYSSVKFGNEALAEWGLANGIKYVADDRAVDQFIAPVRLLDMARRGAGAADCDDHTMLDCAIAKGIGFRVGFRAYGPPDITDGYDHVYGVALAPKRGPWKKDSSGAPLEEYVVGMDTTHPPAQLGWQPKKGRVMTLWLE